ncbi:MULTISPECIES: PAS domain-containing protein [Myxococcaceae]|uniref:PAS domain-containing protein n=1 Tax=Myxococcaceae TaxID=31 RepID=UPI0018904018|nr:PAS domain-containing protein [Simulacricoccus sp. 17bor-14]
MKRQEQPGPAPAPADPESQARTLAFAHEAVVLVDMEGRILFWSEGARALYGYSAQEALGQKVQVLLRTELPMPMEEAWAQTLRQGQWTGDVVHTTRSGARVTVHSHWALSADGAGGRTLLLSNRDITERKEAERQRIEALALLEGLLDSAPVGLAFVDRDLRYVRINRVLAAMNGVPPEHTVGRTVREVVGDAVADLVEPVMRFVFESGQPVHERELASSLPAAPQRRAWRLSHYPVRDAQGRVHVVGTVVQDITESLRDQERTARLQAATSALSRALTPEEVGRVVLSEAVRGLGARRGLAYLRERGERRLRVLAEVGYGGAVPERVQVLDAEDRSNPVVDVLHLGEPVWIESMEEFRQRYPGFVPLPGAQASAAWAALPMHGDDQPVGSLLLSFTEARTLSPQDRSFLRVLAQQCAIALERARLYREARGAG